MRGELRQIEKHQGLCRIGGYAAVVLGNFEVRENARENHTQKSTVLMWLPHTLPRGGKYVCFSYHYKSWLHCNFYTPPLMQNH